MSSYLNQILALSLRDERLELRCRERIHQSRFRHDKQQNLCPSQDRQFIGLSTGRTRVSQTNRTRANVSIVRGSPTFFMIPAFRFENVMWRRDLSWMNLISIFRRSRLPPFASSSSSSSASLLGRGRLRVLSLVGLTLGRWSTPLPVTVADEGSMVESSWGGGLLWSAISTGL